VSVGVRSIFGGPAPASAGGRMMRTDALPVVCVSPSDPPPTPFVLERPRAPPDEPKMFVSPGCSAPTPGCCSGPRRGSPVPAKNGSPAKSSSAAAPASSSAPASSRASMARMTRSETPLRFNSIRRSGDRSKRAGRERRMAMIVFSLNFARTNLTTDAFVSTASAPGRDSPDSGCRAPPCADADCAHARIRNPTHNAARRRLSL
jgi:hypothetical protein